MEPTTPIEKVRMTPKDFFFHLAAIVILYAAVISLLDLLFSVIDAAFPSLDAYYYSAPSIAWPVAMLIILTPLFLIFMWLIEKENKLNPAKRNLGIKRWLTYITLFLTGGVIVGDLITVLYYFLDGQSLTGGFILKVLAVLVVSALVFGYYFSSIKNPERTASKNKLWVAITLVVVLASIIWGFTVIGSPITQRKARYDTMRVNDLESIQYQVINYWQQKGSLPKTLGDLNNPQNGYEVPTDPQTKAPYGYGVEGTNQFQVCANFGTKSNTPVDGQIPSADGATGNTWSHGVGLACFTRTIDPAQYPTSNNNPANKPMIPASETNAS